MAPLMRFKHALDARRCREPPTYPKKMNAFWKKTAMPGYTTGFSARDNTFTAFKMSPHL